MHINSFVVLRQKTRFRRGFRNQTKLAILSLMPEMPERLSDRVLDSQYRNWQIKANWKHVLFAVGKCLMSFQEVENQVTIGREFLIRFLDTTDMLATLPLSRRKLFPSYPNTVDGITAHGSINLILMVLILMKRSLLLKNEHHCRNCSK